MEDIFNKNMSITNTDVWGFDHALRGMRNPFNSHSKSDTHIDYEGRWTLIGENDMKLAQKLIKAGSEHAKFLRQIHVSADFKFPRFIWQEMDTYKFMEKNSESTIHKLLNNTNPIIMSAFIDVENEDDVVISSLRETNKTLEVLRQRYLEIKNTTKDQKELDKLLHLAKIILPEGFLQTRTIDTNYAELRNMWLQRVRYPHRMKEEWVNTFGAWIDTLPYAEELIKVEK